MWSFIVQNIVLSILVVLLAQYLWDYFKPTNYSRKTRDIVDFQTKKYREMLKDIQESQPAQSAIHDDEYISAEEKDRMVSELLSFIEVGDL
jgi:hypothetical protein